MPTEIKFEHKDLVVARVSGMLGKEEPDREQRKSEEIIRKSRHAKILAITEGFSRWARDNGWDDVSFQARNDKDIERIAIVGEAKWRELIFAFIGKGFRPAAIEHFGPGQEALAPNGWRGPKTPAGSFYLRVNRCCSCRVIDGKLPDVNLPSSPLLQGAFC